MNQRAPRLPALLAVSSFIVVLSGCASPATHQGMIPATFETVARHPHSVSVYVTGGQETNSMWISQISDSAFSQALVESITKSQVFTHVIEGRGGDYLLTVLLASMDQPSFGGSLTVRMEAGWTLKNAATGAVVWQESVHSSHTATMGDAFIGAERLRLATEGAARNNIRLGLGKISGLKL
jgi:hypothetical protein